MTTIVERDSSGSSALAIVLLAILVAAGLAIAYWSGAFGGKTTIIENNRTIERHEAPANPPSAPEAPKPPDAVPQP